MRGHLTIIKPSVKLHVCVFRFIFSGTLENAVVIQALRWNMRDGACMMSCNSVNRNVLMWNKNTDNKSLMPGWSVFYGLRNDSPTNACCRRCASLQKQECAAPYRYCRGLEMALCPWARLYVGKFSDMQNMKTYFHCFIYSLWTEIRWPWVAPTWYFNWLQYQSRYFGSTIPCLRKLVDH